MEGRPLVPAIRKYFMFSKEEIKALVISIIVIAFIFSFREWGTDVFDVIIGLFNFMNALILTALALVVHVSAQRLYAIKSGLRAEYKLWWYGILIGLVLVFVSNGWIWFLATGGLLVHFMPGRRIGYFRYGLRLTDQARIALMGPIANIALAFFFKFALLLPFNAFLIGKAVLINVWLAVFNMLPIPPLPGFMVFSGSRLGYAFTFSFILAAAIMMTWFGFLTSILGSLLIAIIGFFLWLVIVEKF